MKKRFVPLVVASLVAASVAPALAENREGAVSLTPFIGGYTFDGTQHLRTRPVYGLRAGYEFTKNVGVEGLFDYVNTKGTKGGGSVDAFRYGLDGLYNFLPDGPVVPFLAAGFGGTTVRGRANAAFNYGGGIKYFLTDSLVMRGDVRHIIVTDDTNHNLEYTAGIGYLFGGARSAVPVVAPVRDSDRDGVPDTTDRCPDTPNGVGVDAEGCPPDSDRDGVPDYKDKCPDTPAGVKVDADGCPLDSDRDGVADYKDKCLDTPAGVKVDADGCPLDSDHDGVADYKDKCPDTPAGVKVDADGCPLDSDHDGVPDYADKCPETPANTPVDKDGCKVEKICITLNVQFDTNSAEIKPQYHDEIARAADFMKKYPSATSVIEGHTDNVGSAEYNIKLSQRRAESVRRYLIEKFGVDSSRLSAKGYGFAKPVADNATEAGRQKNRRIDAMMDCVVIRK